MVIQLSGAAEETRRGEAAATSSTFPSAGRCVSEVEWLLLPRHDASRLMGHVLRRCRGDLLRGRAAQSANLEVISVWGYLVQACSEAALLPPVQRPSPAQPSPASTACRGLPVWDR